MKIQRMTSFLLTLCMVVTLLPGIPVVAATDDLTVTIDTGASITLTDSNGDSYYEIGTADELYAFAALVNGGNTNINAIVTADIVVNENVLTANGELSDDAGGFRTWVPIGNSKDTSYTGTFDGCNKVISGLYLNYNRGELIGLFGCNSDVAVVQNVDLLDTYFHGNEMIGGIVGFNSGIVSNCNSDGFMRGSQYVVDAYGIITSWSVGGVVGVNTGKVLNCTNTGCVVAEYYVGGVVGENSGSTNNCYNLGGVCGEFYVGGVVGWNSEIVDRCCNNGTVSGEEYLSGGVVGLNYEGAVTNCYNTGGVFGNDYVGGITGSCSGTIANCYGSGIVNGNKYVGGITGSCSGTITNCYYLENTAVGGVNGVDVSDGAVVKSSGQFASGEVAYLLQNNNSEQVWGQTIGTNAAPTLGGDTVYQVTNSDGGMIYSNTNENIEHSWIDATCTTPRTCAICGATEGEAWGHFWTDAICTEPKTCLECGITEGEPTGIHIWEDATCASPKMCIFCSEWDGDPLPHSYQSETIAPTCSAEGCTRYTCTECGDSYTDDEVPIVPHATYNSNGFCVDCGNGCQPCGGSGTAEDPYTIGNAGQLYWFAAAVNGGDPSACGVLTADIVVNEGTMSENAVDPRMWTPIGNLDNQYSGSFDGAEHTVSGLYFHDTSAMYVGLFGFVSSGTVKNVGVINSWISAKCNTGGIVGICSEGFVINCYHSGTVIGTAYHIGGIAGDSSGTIKNCHNSGTVRSNGSWVGGIVGTMLFGSVENSYNTGNVSGGGSVGGITGSITHQGALIKHCYNSGSISGNGSVGGIAGYSEQTISNCFNTGAINGSGTWIGSVVGRNQGSVMNCYYVGDTADGDDYAEAKTAAQFASGEVAYLLRNGNSEQVWGQTIGTDAAPTLGGDTVYRVENCDGETSYSNVNENIDHNLIHHDAEAPTCTEHGWEAYDTCENCDYSTYEEIAATGHSYSYQVTNAPTVNGDGTLTGTCGDCSETDLVTLPMLNDTDYTYTVEEEPTDTTVGVGRYTWNTTDYGTFYFDVEIEAEESVEIVLGDVDGNGVIDTTDYIRVKAAFLGIFELSEVEFLAADVDRNSIIDTTDYMRIKAHFLGTYVIE